MAGNSHGLNQSILHYNCRGDGGDLGHERRGSLGISEIWTTLSILFNY